MSKFEKMLQEWVSHGLIDLSHAQKIRAFESAKPESAWILSGLLALGVIIVGIGIVSMIAANWVRIPNGVKLAGDFALLLSVGSMSVHLWERRKPIHFEGTLLLFSILCLASIGLISQIYHTGGSIYQALMLWSIITCGIPFVAKHMLVPFFWATGFSAGIAWAVVDVAALRLVFENNPQAIMLAFPLLFAVLSACTRPLPAAVAAMRAFRAWTLIWGLIVLLGTEFFARSAAISREYLTAFVPGYIMAAIVVYSIQTEPTYRKIQKHLLLATLGAFLSLFHLPLLNVSADGVYAAFTLVVLGFFAVFLASSHQRTLFQWFIFLVAARCLGLYFQAFGGLALTGMGLIVSGSIVIGMTVMWNRYRVALAEWTERWVQ